MNAADDFAAEPRRVTVDDAAAEIAFGHSSDSEAIPEAVREIVELVQVARRPGSVDELIGDDIMIARVAAIVEQSQTRDDPSRRARSGPRRSAKLAAVATAILMVGSTAAAASGSLPPRLQNSLASRLSGVGIDLPRRTHRPHHTTSTSAATGRHGTAALAAARGHGRAPGLPASTEAHPHSRAVSTRVGGNRTAAPASCASVRHPCHRSTTRHRKTAHTAHKRRRARTLRPRSNLNRYGERLRAIAGRSVFSVHRRHTRRHSTARISTFGTRRRNAAFASRMHRRVASSSRGLRARPSPGETLRGWPWRRSSDSCSGC